MRELDDRSESLKLSASEVLDLRRQIKQIMDVNNHLRSELGKNSNINIDRLANKDEILCMGDEELRSRIIAITQARAGAK